MEIVFCTINRNDEVSKGSFVLGELKGTAPMPDIQGSFTTDFFVSRFLLRPARKYDEAVKTFSPYKSVQDPYSEGRRAIETLATKKPLRSSYIFVNNRLEGNALGTIAGAFDKPTG